MYDQILEWYKKNYNKVFTPDTGLVRQESIRDKDWAIGRNLYGQYQAGQQLESQYKTGVQSLQQERQTSRETADILSQKLMKYHPTYNKAIGLGGSGMSETAALQAQSDYANRVSGITQNVGQREQQLLDAYQTGKLDLQAGTADREMEILNRYAGI